MLFDRFAQEASHFWNAYLANVRAQELRGALDSRGGEVLYPTMLIVVDAGPHYIAELIGASPTNRPLVVKRMAAANGEQYFNQFNTEAPAPAIRLDADGSMFGAFAFGNEFNRDQVAKRFPQINGFKTFLQGTDTHGGAIGFGSNFRSHAFQDCMLVNKVGEMYRCKYILHATVVSKATQPARLANLLRKFTQPPRVAGVHTIVAGTGGRIQVAAHLQSLYLTDPHETMIGEYLNQHRDVLLEALEARQLIYEPTFRWIEKPAGCEDDSINPDLLVQDRGGRWDIYDLKKGLLTRTSITTGGMRRRRFVAPVYDGIAQLAHYRSYFSFPQNAAYAAKEFGIKIDAPRLVLVVGSFENVREEEVAQASRGLDAHFEIIDYDTLCSRISGRARNSDVPDSFGT